MTNKQSWIEDISAWCFSRDLTNGDFVSLSKEISKILTSKSEQMEREFKDRIDFYVTVGTHKEYVTSEERNFNEGFNAGISKCLEILKK